MAPIFFHRIWKNNLLKDLLAATSIVCCEADMDGMELCIVSHPVFQWIISTCSFFTNVGPNICCTTNRRTFKSVANSGTFEKVIFVQCSLTRESVLGVQALQGK